MGFAHGFRVFPSAHVTYKATSFYAPEYERTILWNDPELNIDWGLDGFPTSLERCFGQRLRRGR